MSFRESVLERLPDNVDNLFVDRADVYGLPAIHCRVEYHEPNGHPWILDMKFTNKNHMTAEHIAGVLKSYMKYDASRETNWESEGGNGSNRT